MIEQWRVQYNTMRPQSSLCYGARRIPEAILPKQLGHGDLVDAAPFPNLHTRRRLRQMSKAA